MEQHKTIHFFFTGGTIDSHWDGKHDTAVPNAHSAIPEFLNSLQLYKHLEFTEIVMKDSRDLTSEDVEKLMSKIEESNSNRIIIAHGTYTMADTAKFLKEKLKRKDQTIVLTGSMAPMQGFTISDAPFNLGYAIAKVEELRPGVYIAMNGKSFSAEEAAKNVKEGKFYSIFHDKQ